MTTKVQPATVRRKRRRIRRRLPEINLSAAELSAVPIPFYDLVLGILDKAAVATSHADRREHLRYLRGTLTGVQATAPLPLAKVLAEIVDRVLLLADDGALRRQIGKAAGVLRNIRDGLADGLLREVLDFIARIPCRKARLRELQRVLRLQEESTKTNSAAPGKGLPLPDSGASGVRQTHNV